VIESPAILITDDDRAFRETLECALLPQGYQTYLAADGEEAVEVVRSRDVHVVLLDMHMPKLTGVETIRQVKQYQAQLPCILISAALDAAMIRQAEEVDAFGALAKPITREQLTSTIDAALWHTYGWRR